MQVPSDYKNAGTFMLISGILTILTSIGLIAGLIWVCVGAFWVVTLAGAAFELFIGVAVMGGQYKANVKTASIAGLVSAILCGNVIGLVLEIIVLVNLGKPEVTDWMNAQASATP